VKHLHTLRDNLYCLFIVTAGGRYSYRYHWVSNVYFLDGVYLRLLSYELLLGLKSLVLFLQVSTLGFIYKRGEDGRTGWVVNCREAEDKLCVNGSSEDWWRLGQFVGFCGVSRGRKTVSSPVATVVWKMAFWVGEKAVCFANKLYTFLKFRVIE